MPKGIPIKTTQRPNSAAKGYIPQEIRIERAGERIKGILKGMDERTNANKARKLTIKARGMFE